MGLNRLDRQQRKGHQTLGEMDQEPVYRCEFYPSRHDCSVKATIRQMLAVDLMRAVDEMDSGDCDEISSYFHPAVGNPSQLI